jgi:hypothetical protein
MEPAKARKTPAWNRPRTLVDTSFKLDWRSSVINVLGREEIDDEFSISMMIVYFKDNSIVLYFGCSRFYRSGLARADSSVLSLAKLTRSIRKEQGK